MHDSRNRLFVFGPVLVLAFTLAGCTGEPEAEADVASAVEPAADQTAAANMEMEGGVEAAGEHSEGGESREGGEHSEGGEAGEGGEHADGGEGGQHDEGGEGEESGVYIAKGATWDVVRRGARLILTFDPATNAFTGTVENTTASTLCAVRVEVHLSGGTELGPTARIDVAAGQSIDVTLSTGGAAFDTWTAHPELSACPGG